MVNSNLHRENLKPSEKAFAYKIKLEALKKQGKRTDLTSFQFGTKYKGSTSVITTKITDGYNEAGEWKILGYLLRLMVYKLKTEQLVTEEMADKAAEITLQKKDL